MTAPEGIFARDLLGLVESRWRKENISSGQSNVYSEISLSILIRSPLEGFIITITIIIIIVILLLLSSICTAFNWKTAS
jgi:hypothetical protein